MQLAVQTPSSTERIGLFGKVRLLLTVLRQTRVERVDGVHVIHLPPKVRLEGVQEIQLGSAHLKADRVLALSTGMALIVNSDISGDASLEDAAVRLARENREKAELARRTVNVAPPQPSCECCGDAAHLHGLRSRRDIRCSESND